MHTVYSSLLQLYEALAVTTVGCDLIHYGPICDKQQVHETLAEFASLGVTQEHRVSNVELLCSLVADGSLNFTCSFERKEPGTARKVWLRQLIGTGRARGDVTASQAGIDGTARSPYDLDGKANFRYLPAVGFAIAVAVRSRWQSQLRG